MAFSPLDYLPSVPVIFPDATMLIKFVVGINEGCSYSL